MASPNISFDTIPSSIRKPGVYAEFNTRLAVRTLPSNKQRLILLGQRLSTGTVAASVITKVFSDEEAAVYFGRGSVLHVMVAAAIRANPYAGISCMALDDAASSTAGAGSITFSGAAASSAGVLTIGIASTNIDMAVAVGDTPAQLAARAWGLLTARTSLPITTSADSNVVSIQAKNKGTVGNDVQISVTGKVPGINTAVAFMAGGAVDPDLNGTFSLLFPASDEIVVMPWIKSPTLFTQLVSYLDGRGGSIEQRGAVGVLGSRESLSTVTTSAGQINAGRITFAALPATAAMGIQIASAYAAVIASEEDPARPLNDLPLAGIPAPNQAAQLGRGEQEVCLANGVTPLKVGPGDQVQIVRAITTYTVNAAGTADISLLDLTTIRTLDYARKAWRERIALRFPRDKKTDDKARKVRSELLDVAFKLEELEIIEHVEENKDGFIVENDSQDPNRLNARLPTDVVNGLHVFAARIDLLL